MRRAAAADKSMIRRAGCGVVALLLRGSTSSSGPPPLSDGQQQQSARQTDRQRHAGWVVALVRATGPAHAPHTASHIDRQTVAGDREGGRGM